MIMRRCLTTLATSVAILCTATPVAAEPSYVGAKKCKMCHIKQYTTWEQTNMARSFDLLKAGVKADEKKAAGLDPAADYTADPKCLSCHTTGYLKKGGFESIAATPHLVGVQCEACHGPGSDYLAKDKMSLENKEYKRPELVAAGLVVPHAGTCTTSCHNEKSPFLEPGELFDFETKTQKGTHEHIALKFAH